MFEELIPIKPCSNKKYLAWIRSKDCLVCGKPAVAHHCEDILPSRGMSVKHDLLAVPLCPWHHNGNPFSVHEAKFDFWETEGIDIEKRIIFYLIDYFGG